MQHICKNLLLLAGIIIFFSAGLSAQSTYLPSGHEWNEFLQRLEIKSGRNSSHFHAVFKPLERKSVIGFLEEADTSVAGLTRVDHDVIRYIRNSNAEWGAPLPDSSKRSLFGYFYKHPSDLYRYQDEELFLVINPVIHAGLGRERDHETWVYQNTRGAELRGMINKKVGFYSYLADNQARFPSWVNRKIDLQDGAIPGEGWNIPFGDSGYDYFTARGYIAFQATRNIGLQFGQDRNFTGYGDRSLLLSDFSNNYLFLKVNTIAGRFHYQNIFARLVDFPLRSYGGRMFDSKYMAAHTLSINITPRFQLGFFENVVFGRADTLSRRGFEPHYLNPIIFYRAVEHHIGDPDKVALGLNWRWIAGHRLAFYGQVYIDDFLLSDVRNDVDSMLVYLGLRSKRKYSDFASFRNKFGFQAGINWIDLFGIDNLDLRLEGNWVRPFTYSHYDASAASLRPAGIYSHYSQPLAHPLGANFREFVAGLQYRPHKDWLIAGKVYSANQGMDSTGVNMGGNIMRDYTSRASDYGNTFLQGYKRKSLLASASIAWQWRPNIWLDLNYTLRKETFEDPIQTNTNTGILQIGLRVNAVRREYGF